MLRTCLSIMAVAFLVLAGVNAWADDQLADFQTQLRPLLESHCHSCHDSDTSEAELDLTRFHTARDVANSHAIWLTILKRIEAGEMPPADAEPVLNDSDRRTLANRIRRILESEAQQHAGDPGPVVARRLSNAEYDYSIRDLTGADIRPTQTFPVDPANEAGFDNSAESLNMSPALIKKYLEAARLVADHVVLTPTTIRFAPHPVVTDTDRDKYCVRRIVEFYQRQPTHYSDYFFAAWTYRHREMLGKPNASLAEIAKEAGISAKYLAMIWDALSDKSIDLGPMVRLRSMWQELPDGANPEQAKTACDRMREYVVQIRARFEPQIEGLKVDGIHDGTQAFVLWKNKQYAAHRRLADFSGIDNAEEPTGGDSGNDAKKKRRKRGDRLPDELAMQEFSIDPPAAAERDRFRAACSEFCSLFPDAFYISERGRDYVGKSKDQQEKGRLLSAGFHSMMGYYRDDLPLYQLILDEDGQRELDTLWQELDFFTAAPLRQYQGFLWFDRTDSRYMRDPEFDFARPEDKASLQESAIQKLAEVYLAKAVRQGASEVPLQAIRDYFDQINQQIRWVETARTAAEPFHLKAVIDFAGRAYRRPLTNGERESLTEFYQSLREHDQLSHEEAIQDTIVSVLMSPHFCFRLDLLADSDHSRALTDYELASRMSFWLWSSLPDAELLSHAAAGDLHRHDVLIEQANRMLRDDRTRALAVEFGGNWLDFRRFNEHNSVDRQRFPGFDDELRSAMYEEPVRFLLDMIQNDRSTLDMLYARRTFVNDVLAKHYGMADVSLKSGQWREVSNADEYGRGGLLPMAVFMTKNAPGLRTSPVKRGYWVVRRLLGEQIAAPPPDVPDLPEDESQLGELTLKQTLAMHRDHPSCAGCHERFDAVGVAFEGYGPVGEARTVDLGGRPIDTSATFPDGSERAGIEGLRSYLRQRREQDFTDNLCRKLLTYSLGRSLLLSDEPLLKEMQESLANHGYRFDRLVHAIALSPQFLNKRGHATPIQSHVHAGETDE